MRKIRDVLRLSFGEELSRRQVSASLGIPVTTVSDHVMRAVAAGLSWPLPAELDDHGLEQLLFPPVVPKGIVRPTPDWKYVHVELRERRDAAASAGSSAREDHPDGYGYSQFANLYRAFRRQVDVVMRQEHRAGEKLFVDFPGQTIPIYDRRSGEVTLHAELFVAEYTGASNYLYAEAFASQGASVLGDHAHPRLRVSWGDATRSWLYYDNLRSGVTRPHRYEPDVNATFQEMAAHYGVAIIPTRTYKPRDKAKANQACSWPSAWMIAGLEPGTLALRLSGEPGHLRRRVRGLHQLSPVQEAGRLTQDPVRGFGPPGAQATSARALRVRHL